MSKDDPSDDGLLKVGTLKWAAGMPRNMAPVGCLRTPTDNGSWWRHHAEYCEREGLHPANMRPLSETPHQPVAAVVGEELPAPYDPSQFSEHLHGTAVRYCATCSALLANDDATHCKGCQASEMDMGAMDNAIWDELLASGPSPDPGSRVVRDRLARFEDREIELRKAHAGSMSLAKDRIAALEAENASLKAALEHKRELLAEAHRVAQGLYQQIHDYGDIILQIDISGRLHPVYDTALDGTRTLRKSWVAYRDAAMARIRSLIAAGYEATMRSGGAVGMDGSSSADVSPAPLPLRALRGGDGRPT